ncbi:hypothetical protein [Saccharopolyspora sp. NPDC050642]|uniref:hypothetical protein n=1 Tax=Saccharopolyspora sp. NPDC050642 TaxID=3157099 RepID=UPI0033E93836
MTEVEAPLTGARTLVAIATTAVLLPWLLFCLLVVVVSLPWETGPTYYSTMAVWGALGVIGLLIGGAQLVIALSGRTRKSVLLRGIPALVLAPLALCWSIAFLFFA